MFRPITAREVAMMHPRDARWQDHRRSPLPEGIVAEVLLGVLGVRSPCMEAPREAVYVCGLDSPRSGGQTAPARPAGVPWRRRRGRSTERGRGIAVGRHPPPAKYEIEKIHPSSNVFAAGP